MYTEVSAPQFHWRYVICLHLTILGRCKFNGFCHINFISTWFDTCTILIASTVWSDELWGQCVQEILVIRQVDSKFLFKYILSSHDISGSYLVLIMNTKITRYNCYIQHCRLLVPHFSSHYDESISNRSFMVPWILHIFF